MRRHATTTMIAAVLGLLLFSGRLAAAEKSFGGGGAGAYAGLEVGGGRQQPQPAVVASRRPKPSNKPSPSTPAAAAEQATRTTTRTAASSGSSGGGGGYVTPAAGNVGLDPDGDPEVGLNGKAIKEILSEHNLFRYKEHAGLPLMVWNKTLAAWSQEYAEKALKVSCQQIHSTSPYGENLMEGTPGLTWRTTVEGWSEERKNYHYDTNSCDPGKMCGHYKAVVWKDTTSVGCGRIKCNSGDTIIMCSYWPPGNFDGEKPY